MNDFQIITYHRTKNYGAALQTFALQSFIRQLGHSCAVYDYRPPVASKPAGLRGKATAMLQGLHRSEFRAQKALFEQFFEEHLELTTERSCRVFLTGSDQVWNTAGAMGPMFYLQFVGDECLRASYAASMGKAAVPELKRALFSRYINNLDAVSVRESDVQDLLKDIYSGEVLVHCDPTLLHDKAFWRQYARPVEGLPERYTLAYILRPAKNMNRLLRWLKRQTGDEIVVLDSDGIHSLFAKRDKTVRAAGPAEFLWLIDHARRVVTTSFHGTTFSLIFEKELYSLHNPASPARAAQLLSRFDMETIPENAKRFERRTDQDWNAVRAVMDAERTRSADYLNGLFARALRLKRDPVRGTVAEVQDACSGCSACAAACPTGAITMRLKKKGFFEPVIDSVKCISCSKCLRLCPQNRQLGNLRREVFWGWNRSGEERMASTSGGVMRSLADEILRKGGIVFGAAFSEDYRSVILTDTDHVPISALQRSKYAASEVGDSFRRVKSQLESGRRVMFCASPCQCAGLTAYLNQEYPNLLICDFVCGGMPSLGFYREHLKTLEEKYRSPIDSLTFRPKGKGWGKTALEIRFANGKQYRARGYQDAYYKAFAILHSSVSSACLQCRYSHFHASDLTLADFWGHKNAGIPYDPAGISLVSANTERGSRVLADAKGLCLHPLEMKDSDYAFRAKGPNLTALASQKQFFQRAEALGSFEASFFERNRVGLLSQATARIKRILHLK